MARNMDRGGKGRGAGNLSHTCVSALILFVQELMHKSVDVFRLTTRLPLSRISIAKGLLLFYILISLPWLMSLFGHALRFSPRTITEFNLSTVASHTVHSFGPETLCRDSDPFDISKQSNGGNREAGYATAWVWHVSDTPDKHFHKRPSDLYMQRHKHTQIANQITRTPHLNVINVWK